LLSLFAGCKFVSIKSQEIKPKTLKPWNIGTLNNKTMKKATLLSAILLCIVGLSSGQWTYTNLSEANYRMGAATLGTKAYFAGGEADGGQVSAVEIYNIETEDWDSTINLSVARSHPACAGAGSKVFIAGGVNFNTMEFYDDVDIWDAQTKTWSFEHLLFPRFSIGAMSHGNKVMFAGGADLMNGMVFDIVEIYDIETGGWSFTTLSMARCAFAYAVAGDLAIIAGGFDLQTVTDRVDIYNFTTGTWTTASLSHPRGFLAAAVAGNKVLIAGGVDPDNILSDRVDIYDIETNTWDTAHLSEPRAMFQESAVSICDNRAFFAGGGALNLNTLNWEAGSNVIDIYDVADDSWTVENLTQPVVMHTTAGVEDHMIVAGGITYLDPEWYRVSKVEIYDDPACLWNGIDPREEVGSLQSSVVSYPNPTNGISHFTFRISQYQYVTLKIYDFQGREVAVVLDKALSAGEHTIQWNAEGLPAGMYYYRLSTNDYRLTTASGKLVKY
jgi:N-acetylneuraminic acid mutarotase